MSYLEGCTAPMRDENQLHAAVVELVALDDASIKYSTVQNWYPGDENGVGGIYNFVTKRGDCRGAQQDFLDPGGTGSAITWKYPNCVLRGDDSVGEFSRWRSPTIASRPTPAPDDSSRPQHQVKIISKGISAGRSQNTYRGLVKVEKSPRGAQLHPVRLAADRQAVRRAPSPIEVKHPGAIVEHEATTSKISDDQLFYCRSRGIGEDAVSMIVDGFCKQVFKELPMEFAVEAKKLLEVSLEGAVGWGWRLVPLPGVAHRTVGAAGRCALTPALSRWEGLPGGGSLLPLGRGCLQGRQGLFPSPAQGRGGARRANWSCSLLPRGEGAHCRGKQAVPFSRGEKVPTGRG